MKKIKIILIGFLFISCSNFVFAMEKLPELEKYTEKEKTNSFQQQEILNNLDFTQLKQNLELNGFLKNDYIERIKDTKSLEIEKINFLDFKDEILKEIAEFKEQNSNNSTYIIKKSNIIKRDYNEEFKNTCCYDLKIEYSDFSDELNKLYLDILEIDKKTTIKEKMEQIVKKEILNNLDFTQLKKNLELKGFLKNNYIERIKNEKKLEIEKISFQDFKNEILKEIIEFKEKNLEDNLFVLQKNNLIKKDLKDKLKNNFCYDLEIEFKQSSNELNLKILKINKTTTIKEKTKQLAKQKVLNNLDFKQFEKNLKLNGFLKNDYIEQIKDTESLEIEKISFQDFKDEILKKLVEFKEKNPKNNIYSFQINNIIKRDYNEELKNTCCYDLKIKFKESLNKSNKLYLDILKINKNTAMSKNLIKKLITQQQNNNELIKKEKTEQKQKKINFEKDEILKNFLKELDENDFVKYDFNKEQQNLNKKQQNLNKEQQNLNKEQQNLKKEHQIKFLKNNNIETILYVDFFNKILLKKIKETLENEEQKIEIKNIIDNYWNVYTLELFLCYNKYSNKFNARIIRKKNKMSLPLNNFNYPYKDFKNLKSNLDYITYSGKIYDICNDSQTFKKNENNLITPFKELQFSKNEINSITTNFNLYNKPNRLEEILKILKTSTNEFIKKYLDFSDVNKIEKKFSVPEKDLSIIFSLIENANFEKLNTFKNILNSNQYIRPNILNITIYNLRENETAFCNLPPIIIIPAVKFPNKIKNALKNLFKQYSNDEIEHIISFVERKAAKEIKNLELELQPTSKKGHIQPIKLNLPVKWDFVEKILEVEVFFNYNGIFFGNFTIKNI